MSKNCFVSVVILAACIFARAVNPSFGTDTKSPYELLAAICKDNPGIIVPRSAAEAVNRWSILECLYNRTIAARQLVSDVAAEYKNGRVSADLLISVTQNETAAVEALQAELQNIGR